MPLKYTQVEGKPTGLFLALLGSGVSTAPSDVTITVDTAGATAGDTTIPITDPGTDIPKNTILTFDDSNTTKVVVTSDFSSGSSGDLDVEDYFGAEGDGIANDLSAADAATWDQLYTVVATEALPFTNNPQTQELSAVTHGSGSGVSIQDPSVQSKAPQIAVSGLFIAEGQLVQDIIQYADSNRDWWARHTTPDADGAVWKQREGLARVSDLNEEHPSDGLVRLSYNVRFRQAPTLTFPGVS